MKVVFPAPLRPSSPWMLPGATRRLTPATAYDAPYRRVSPRVSSLAGSFTGRLGAARAPW